MPASAVTSPRGNPGTAGGGCSPPAPASASILTTPRRLPIQTVPSAVTPIARTCPPGRPSAWV